MAKGFKPGRQKTGGRQKGVANKKTQELVNAVIETGITPLDYLLKVMRDAKADLLVRLDAAKAAAPYVHPKLSSIEIAGNLTHYDASKLTDSELATIATASSARADSETEGKSIVH